MEALEFFNRSLFPIKVTPQNLVYLGNENNSLISLPFFDPQISAKIIGFDIEGTCFLLHPKESNMAPYVKRVEVNEYLKNKTTEVFGSVVRPVELPTVADLTNWSKRDRLISQTLYAAELGSKGRCENGVYFANDGNIVRVRHGQISFYFRDEDTGRVLPVIHLDQRDFRGQLSGGEAIVQKTIDQLFKLKQA